MQRSDRPHNDDRDAKRDRAADALAGADGLVKRHVEPAREEV